jgi:hypothetical protein
MATLRPSLIPTRRGLSLVPQAPPSVCRSLSNLSFSSFSSLYPASRPLATLPARGNYGTAGIRSTLVLSDKVRTNAEQTSGTTGSSVQIRKMSTGRRKIHVKNPVVELDGDEVRLIFTRLPPFVTKGVGNWERRRLWD